MSLIFYFFVIQFSQSENNLGINFRILIFLISCLCNGFLIVLLFSPLLYFVKLLYPFPFLIVTLRTIFPPFFTIVSELV